MADRRVHARHPNIPQDGLPGVTEQAGGGPGMTSEPNRKTRRTRKTTAKTASPPDLDGKFVVIEWARGTQPGARLTLFDTQEAAQAAADQYTKRAEANGWEHRYTVATVAGV